MSLVCHLGPLLVQRPDVAADAEQHLTNARVQVAFALVLHKVQVAQKLLKPLSTVTPQRQRIQGGASRSSEFWNSEVALFTAIHTTITPELAITPKFAPE